MEPFTTHKGIVAPLDRANIDTDLIIPKQFLKSVQRTGFGPYLFDQLRYIDEGQPGMDCSKRQKKEGFILNQEPYDNATILLARENFGCGSSREHAPWALLDYGFRVLLAPSFADIFYNNCFKNGILPIVLDSEMIDQLFTLVSHQKEISLQVELESQVIILPDGENCQFDIDHARKVSLLQGLDDIGITLKSEEIISAYELEKKALCPWAFADIQAEESSSES